MLGLEIARYCQALFVASSMKVIFYCPVLNFSHNLQVGVYCPVLYVLCFKVIMYCPVFHKIYYLFWDILYRDLIFYAYLCFYEKRVKQHCSTIPPILTKRTLTFHWTQKRPWIMMLEIQVLVRDRHKSVAGLNHLMLFQPPLLVSGFPTSIHK